MVLPGVTETVPATSAPVPPGLTLEKQPAGSTGAAAADAATNTKVTRNPRPAKKRLP
jgi:hypothetical protein